MDNEERWTICRSITADTIYGPYTGDEEIEVVRASALDRCHEEGERLAADVDYWHSRAERQD